MRLGHALLLVAACGGRTGLSGDAEKRPDAYKIVFGTAHGIHAWHAANGTITNVNTTWSGQILRCTYDGRYLGVADYMTMTSDVLDANGGLVRHLPGTVHAIRPDGMRTILQPADEGNVVCEATFDADGTYGNEHCMSYPQELLLALAYAPDGQTVLWGIGANVEIHSLATGREDGTNQREIAANANAWFASASFSFDGARVAYVECPSGTFVCQLKVVRLDTLATTTVVDEGTGLLGSAFTPDGTKVVFFDAGTSSPEAVDVSLRMVDLETGVISTVVDRPGSDVTDGFCVARDD